METSPIDHIDKTRKHCFLQCILVNNAFFILFFISISLFFLACCKLFNFWISSLFKVLPFLRIILLWNFPLFSSNQKAKNKPIKSTYINVIDTHFIFSSNLLISIFLSSSTKMHFGAGSENRTRATRSEAWHSTTKLYPQLYYTISIACLFFSVKHFLIFFQKTIDKSQ